MDGGLLASLLPLAAFFLVGAFWRRSGLPQDTGFVPAIASRITAPALILSAVTPDSVPFDTLQTLLLAVPVMVLASAAVGWGLLTLLGQDVRALLPCFCFPNIGNLGLPACHLLFGPQGVAVGAMVMGLTTALLWTFGVWLSSGRPEPVRALRQPVVIAAIAALIALPLGVRLPEVLSGMLAQIGALTFPLMVLNLGLQFRRPATGGVSMVMALVIARFVMALILASATATLLGLDSLTAGVLMVQFTMPVGLYTLLLAQQRGSGERDVALFISASTASVFVTLPIAMVLINARY